MRAAFLFAGLQPWISGPAVEARPTTARDRS
jgi:hypothetical protein